MTDYSPAFSRNDKSPIAKWFWTVDRGLLAAALTLVALGVSLSFASSPAAILADQSISDPFHYSWRMIVWASGGTVLMLLALGALDNISVVIRATLMLTYTPDEMRGRVGAVSALTISASNELGEAESGLMASLLGPVGAVLFGGIAAIAITLAWVRLFPELRLAKTFDPPAQ